MDTKHSSSKRYPPALKDLAIRIVRALKLEDPGDQE
jgi:hypothetical protein